MRRLLQDARGLVYEQIHECYRPDFEIRLLDIEQAMMHLPITRDDDMAGRT